MIRMGPHCGGTKEWAHTIVACTLSRWVRRTIKGPLGILDLLFRLATPLHAIFYALECWGAFYCKNSDITSEFETVGVDTTTRKVYLTVTEYSA